jgi:hypothetical protein
VGIPQDSLTVIFSSDVTFQIRHVGIVDRKWLGKEEGVEIFENKLMASCDKQFEWVYTTMDV